MVIAIIGILAAILLPTLSKAKRRAKRTQCIGNLKQIGVTFVKFANDNGGRLPWQLNAMLRAHHQVNSNGTMPNNAYFSLKAFQSELGSLKLLVSPSDPERHASNEAAQQAAGSFTPSNPIPCDAISYLLAEGADMARPNTVLAATHNLSTDSLDGARWIGVDEGLMTANVMALLNKNQGQLLLSDGSARQSQDSDLGAGGKIVHHHRESSGGIYKGPASYRMFTCQPVGAVASPPPTPPPVLADLTGHWYAAVSSDDGGTVTISDNETLQFFHSTDGGATWTPGKKAPGPGAYGYGWRGTATSADGVRLVSTHYGNSLYTSTDTGATWTQQARQGSPDNFASSADGKKLVQVGWNSQVFTSTDSGVTWTSRGIGGDGQGVGSSADGTKLVMLHTFGRIHTSTDSGANWTARETYRRWGNVRSSKDGTKLVAVESAKQIHTSADSGVTWTPRFPGGCEEAMAVSADCTTIVLPTRGNEICISMDFGVTWTTRTFPHHVATACCSADGRKMVVGEGFDDPRPGSKYPYNIWYSHDAGATWAKGKLRK